MFSNLQTVRLILRSFKIEDAQRVQELAGDKEVGKTTLSMPHPYPIEGAENWIKNHPNLIENGDAYPLAIVLKDNDFNRNNDIKSGKATYKRRISLLGW
jgi:RimJ/RimL family protein N-acetyltransferase